MKYIINIDKSPYGNPSEDLRQYEIDIDVLRRKGSVYDSLIIDDTARVIRRIEHKNGEDYILENPIIENLSMIKIELFQGVNYIYITVNGEILSTSIIVIDYLLKNDFTETYPTVIEMHSAIEQSANQITLEVSKKADADKIISLINLSPEQITIDSSRISLEGKEIDLTSDNIIIKSNNFSVDVNGNMTSSNATITGGSLKVGSNFEVNTSGTLTAKNANITGTITSSNATITGGSLKVGNNFSVDTNGNLIAKSAKLTDVSILGYNSSLLISPSEGAYEFTYISKDQIGISSSDESYCYILDSGRIEATNYIKISQLSTGKNTKLTNTNLFIDYGSIRSKDTYDNNTVTNNPNMYITSGGWIRRTTTTSSYRFKKDIKVYKKENNINEELNPEKLYDIKIWQFKYRNEYLKNKKDKRYDKDLIGFILEDMVRKYPIAVDYEDDENGIPRPESWNYQYLIPAMLYLLQEQYKEIENLKSLVKGE